MLAWILLLACGADSGGGTGAAGQAPDGSAAASSPARPAYSASTVVSLAPSLTRILVELRAADRIVGVDTFSAELPEVAQAMVLGGLFAPDLERLVELAPSLVLGVQSSQQQGLFEQLRARGTQVETFRLHSLEQVLAAFERVGELVGARAQGQALARRVRQELDAVAASVADRPRLRVALVIDREPLFVVGGGSFANALIEAGGGENVFGDLEEAYPRVSLEALAERAPDVVLETTQPSPEAERAARSYWSRFAFARRIETLPRGEVVLPSPALAEGARLLRAALHPDLARAAGP